jgi:hypothetical protein
MAFLPTRDVFDRARAWAAAVMVAAGATAVVGSGLDWVTIAVRPELQEGTDFGAAPEQPEAPRVTRPFTGLEARDGWWTAAAGAVLAASGVALYLRRRAGWAWIGLLAAIVIGAVAIADYRGVGDLSSSISHRMNIVGGAKPAIGLLLVVGAALTGLIASVAGMAATPRPEAVRTSA